MNLEYLPTSGSPLKEKTDIKKSRTKITETVTMIMESFKNGKSSDEWSERLHSMANGMSNEENSYVLINVMDQFCRQTRKEGATVTSKDISTFFLKSAMWGSYADDGEKSQGSDSDKKTYPIVEDTQARADQIIAETQAEKEETRAQEQVRPAQDSAKDSTDRSVEAQREDFVHQVSDLIKGYREEDAEVYCESENARKELLSELGKAHESLCTLVKKLQADMNDALTKWRVAFYEKEVRGLADCYVNLHRILNQLDGQISEAAAAQTEEAAARQLVGELGRNRKNLGRFAKQLMNAMLGVGLEVYISKEGDRFDPAQHTLEGGDGNNDALEGWEIARCRVPGVRMLQSGGSVSSFESLIPAEVELK